MPLVDVSPPESNVLSLLLAVVASACDGTTLELTCPTSGAGIRQTVETRVFIQQAWNADNSLRLTLPFGARRDDVELEYVRAARSHQYTSRAAGVDIELPTAISVTTFQFAPFYATYTRVGAHALFLTFAQAQVETGPGANQRVPFELQGTVVRIMPRGYYAGTRLSVTTAINGGAPTFIQRFQLGNAGDRAHLAVFVDVPLSRRCAQYGITYNTIRKEPGD